MKQSFTGLEVRHPTAQDAEAVHALITAREIANHGEPDETLDDVIAEWKDLNLEEDVWLVYSPDEMLVGYAAVYEEKEGYQLFWYSHPEHTEEGLEAQLLAQCQQRTSEKLTKNDDKDEARLWMFISEVDKVDVGVVEAAGFEPYKYYFRMQANSQQEPSAPQWPQGSKLRTIEPGQDDQAVFDFIYTEFDWEGRGEPPKFDWWQGFMMRVDHFVPELWFLLEQDGEIIAAALCYDYPQNGWVRQLAVKKDLRRKGLGSEMLKHVFGVFYRRGQPKVSLVVDSTNPKAQNFYKNVGMYLERQHIEYHKTI